jgi:TonB family protein
VDQIGLLRTSSTHIPQQRRMYAAAWVCYAFTLVAVVAVVRPGPVRMNPAGATQVGIAAFNPGPVGTSGTSPSKPAPTQPVKKPQPTQTTRATSAAMDQAESSEGTGAAAGAQGAGSGSGPVNLGTGAGLTLLKRVVPLYPRLMEQARMPGTVVLDAIIHRDGSIGDVTLKSATNDAFAQAAIDAVKHWRYTPIPYEGIVTVTVNFSPR